MKIVFCYMIKKYGDFTEHRVFVIIWLGVMLNLVDFHCIGLYYKKKPQNFWLKVRQSKNCIFQSCYDYMVENIDCWAVNIKQELQSNSNKCILYQHLIDICKCMSAILLNETDQPCLKSRDI